MFTKYQRDRFSTICFDLFPQMSNILLLKSVPLAQPQSSNKIMCPYYPYVCSTIIQLKLNLLGRTVATQLVVFSLIHYNTTTYIQNDKKIIMT